MTEHQPRTRQQAIARAGKAFAECLAACAQMTPREQAEAAWTPTSPYSVDELEDLIREDRGMEPLDRAEFIDANTRTAPKRGDA